MESQVGYERLFDPQDVFFSTTDLKGVIQNTNRTFDTLSRYSRDRLIGSPHNIIRHLDMPSGLYRLIWDDLKSQRPACGYITNRAVDGLDYRVFATIVPLRQGYLSVRIKPMDTVTRNKVEEAYRRVRGKERDLEARGASRHQLGEFGGRELAAELTALGFSSLHDMTLATLPREVAALVNSGVRVPASLPRAWVPWPGSSTRWPPWRRTPTLWSSSSTSTCASSPPWRPLTTPLGRWRRGWVASVSWSPTTPATAPRPRRRCSLSASPSSPGPRARS